MSPLPLWARALRGFDRFAWYAYHAHEITRDELLFALLDPDLRSDATVAAYSALKTYLPGGATFEGGLFVWEEALLDQPSLRHSGRVLLAAAGGGRELNALLQRGFSVTAFEPNPIFFESARGIAARSANARVFRASYADLVLAASGSGPLTTLRGEAFDWVLFGWGSFTHLTQRSQQLAVLRATHALLPRAPLALSFFVRKPETADSRSERLRRFLRTALRHAGARGPIEPGLGYDYGGGFVYSFTAEELEDLAQEAGYRIAFRDEKIFPHAILLPL